jgi:hypothetical protein
MPHGLHSLFACLRAVNPAVVFFCHTFCNPRTIWHIAFSRSSKKVNKPIHPQAKKKSGTPTATTVPEMRQKKTTQSYIYIMLSYVRFL